MMWCVRGGHNKTKVEKEGGCRVDAKDTTENELMRLGRIPNEVLVLLVRLLISKIAINLCFPPAKHKGFPAYQLIEVGGHSL